MRRFRTSTWVAISLLLLLGLISAVIYANRPSRTALAIHPCDWLPSDHPAADRCDQITWCPGVYGDNMPAEYTTKKDGSGTLRVVCCPKGYAVKYHYAADGSVSPYCQYAG